MNNSQLSDMFTGQFGTTLDAILRRHNVSAYRLAEDAGIDRPYLSRLLRGMNRAPGRQVVIRICYGLARHGVEQIELDGLLVAAGYAPVFLEWKPGAPGEGTNSAR
jgi:transcriptional regulator with XRE-family HTH domain